MPEPAQVDGRGRWYRNPGDLPPAVAAARIRCPICGHPWPPAVPPTSRTLCAPVQ